MKIARTGIILNTERYDECVSFYRDVFKLEVMFQKHDNESYLTCLEYGGAYLMIEQGGVYNASGKTSRDCPSMLRFNVEDIEQTLVYLKSKGIDAEIETYEWGSTININDPDGNRVGIRDEAKFIS